MSTPPGSLTQQIALGTAQFGLDYGITNSAGKVDLKVIDEILDAGWKGGVRLLDTAAAYGGSEEILGLALRRQPRTQWKLVTKTLPVRSATLSAHDITAVECAFQCSLARLGTPCVDTLLVHHAQDLLVPGGAALWDWLVAQRAAGRTQRVGVSVYEGHEARALMALGTPDVVQLPASIADQRLLRDGTVALLAAAGVEIHVRSLYLQGLLLADPAFVGQHFAGQAQWAHALRHECRRRGISPLQACIDFFRTQLTFGVAVIGTTAPQEVDSLLQAWDTPASGGWDAWAVDDSHFTDPRGWNKT